MKILGLILQFVATITGNKPNDATSASKLDNQSLQTIGDKFNNVVSLPFIPVAKSDNFQQTTSLQKELSPANYRKLIKESDEMGNKNSRKEHKLGNRKNTVEQIKNEKAQKAKLNDIKKEGVARQKKLDDLRKNPEVEKRVKQKVNQSWKKYDDKQKNKIANKPVSSINNFLIIDRRTDPEKVEIRFSTELNNLSPINCNDINSPKIQNSEKQNGVIQTITHTKTQCNNKYHSNSNVKDMHCSKISEQEYLSKKQKPELPTVEISSTTYVTRDDLPYRAKDIARRLIWQRFTMFENYDAKVAKFLNGENIETISPSGRATLEGYVQNSLPKEYQNFNVTKCGEKISFPLYYLDLYRRLSIGSLDDYYWQNNIKQYKDGWTSNSATWIDSNIFHRGMKTIKNNFENMDSCIKEGSEKCEFTDIITDHKVELLPAFEAMDKKNLIEYGVTIYGTTPQEKSSNLWSYVGIGAGLTTFACACGFVGGCCSKVTGNAIRFFCNSTNKEEPVNSNAHTNTV